MSFTIEKTFRFEASHLLPGHDGKCRRLHGHSWLGTLKLSDSTLKTSGPKSGMVMDFSDVSDAIADDVENLLDHQHLNDTLPLPSPTSEAIAFYLALEASPAAVAVCQDRRDVY